MLKNLINELEAIILEKHDYGFKKPTIDIDAYSIIFSYDFEEDDLCKENCRKATRNFFFSNYGRGSALTYYNSVIFDGGNAMWSVKKQNDNLSKEYQKSEILLTRTPVAIACSIEIAEKLIRKLGEYDYYEIPTDDFKKSGRGFHKDFNKNPPTFGTFIDALVECCDDFLHITAAGMRWKLINNESYVCDFFDSIETARVTDGLRVGLFQVDLGITTYSGPNKLPQWKKVSYIPPIGLGDVGKFGVDTLPVWNMKVNNIRNYNDQVGGYSVEFKENSQKVDTKGIKQMKLYITSAHYVRNYNKHVPDDSGRWHNVIGNQSIFTTKHQTKLTQKIAYEVLNIARKDGFGHRFELSFRLVGVHLDFGYYITLNDIIERATKVYKTTIGQWFDHVIDKELPTVNGVECKLKSVLGSMLRDLSFEHNVLVKTRLSPVQIQWLEALQMYAMCGMGFSGGGIIRRMREWLEGDGLPYDPDGLCYIMKKLPDCIDVNGNLDEEGRDAVAEFSEALIEEIRLRDTTKSQVTQWMWLEYHEKRKKALLTMEDYEKDIKNLARIEEMGGTEELVASVNDQLRKEMHKIQDEGYCKMANDETSLLDDDVADRIETAKHPLVESDDEEEQQINEDLNIDRIDNSQMIDVTLSNTVNDERRVLLTMAQSRESMIDDQIIDHTCAKWWMQLSEKIYYEHCVHDGDFSSIVLNDSAKMELLNAAKNNHCKHWYEGKREILIMIRELKVERNRKYGGRTKAAIAACLEQHYNSQPVSRWEC